MKRKVINKAILNELCPKCRELMTQDGRAGNGRQSRVSRQKVDDLWQSGCTVAAIAKKMACSRQTVYRALYELEEVI